MRIKQKAEHIRDRISDEFHKAQSFKNIYSDRAPAINTIKGVIKFANGDTSQTPSRASLERISNCLDLPVWKMRGFDALTEQAFLKPDIIATAEEYVGKYKYYRFNSNSQIVSGGLFLEHKQNISCFYHFNNFERLDEFDEKKDQSDLNALHDRVDHVGYYYIEADRVCFLAVGKTYFRVLIAQRNPHLSRKYLRLGVLTRDRDDVAFAARSVAIHHSNPRYSEGISKGDIHKALGNCDPEKSFFRVVPTLFPK